MSSVLMLTPQSPYPPRQGTALRNWGLLKGLAALHRISLLTFSAPDEAQTPDPDLAHMVERVALVPQPSRSPTHRLRDLVTTTFPDLAQRLASAPFRAVLNDWLMHYRFDWILVEGLEMAPYTLKGAGSAANIPEETRIAFDDHNCEYVLQRRTAGSDWRQPARWPSALYSSIQWRRLRRYEAEVCARADAVIAVSAADGAALRAVVPTLDPLVIPNGIDVAAYASFDQAPAFGSGPAPTALAQPAFVFTGTMDFRPNVDGVLWFSNRVWPRIRETLPEAHFYIVGRRPHRRLDALREHPGITVTGNVDDTRPHIRDAAVYVVPLLVGGGTRLKLLEATAMGKAVVATSLAAEGFDRPERAMILADAPDAFAEACIELARDPNARADWGSRARVYVEAYDWANLLPPLLARLG
jgi:glycosyltransferase involved in cell wall biosynthesis